MMLSASVCASDTETDRDTDRQRTHSIFERRHATSMRESTYNLERTHFRCSLSVRAT
jgi:hypothetical protein